MSKLACSCGQVIRDHGEPIAYKAALLRSAYSEKFFCWLAEETQSYIAAVQSDTTTQWLLSKGYKNDYVALKLNHGQVLHDHIFSHYIGLTRDVYECEKCGRLQVETSEDNRFVRYAPESGRNNAVLAPAQPGAPADVCASASLRQILG